MSSVGVLVVPIPNLEPVSHNLEIPIVILVKYNGIRFAIPPVGLSILALTSVKSAKVPFLS